MIFGRRCLTWVDRFRVILLTERQGVAPKVCLGIGPLRVGRVHWDWRILVGRGLGCAGSRIEIEV